MIDQAVHEGLFSGRNELIMFLIRSHIEKMEERDKSKRDYDVYVSRTKKPIQENLDGKTPDNE